MRITSYQEKMKKKGSEFSFKLEGVLSKDGFSEMIRYTEQEVLKTIWGADNRLRCFEKLTVPPVAQDSLTLYNGDGGGIITTILGIKWSPIAVESFGVEDVAVSMKGCVSLLENQLQDVQRCMRDKLSLVLRWFDTQQELALKQKTSEEPVKH